jgi:sulfate adenylyltransferase
MVELIKPHGGELVNRVCQKSAQLPLGIEISRRELCDLELLAVGGLSPLEGFMKKGELESVLYDMRLPNGLPWTIPITLGIDMENSKRVSIGDEVELVYDGKRVGAIKVEEKYEFDRGKEVEFTYGTRSPKHPGVKATLERKDVLVGGKINLFNRIIRKEFEGILDPQETRQIFKERGWKSIVGFQTRNPIHRAHEYIQKTALETVDGLLLHPLVGETAEGDIPADIRIKCYKVLLDKYFPENRVLVSLLPASMRYAGPREAIHHAIIRKNYGCTHFIVGRDHAGVGNFYGPFDAHKIFEKFAQDELGIIPMFFDNAFYCKICQSMATSKVCPHSQSVHLTLSGTEIRKLLSEGKELPREFTRPEVASILKEYFLSER